MMWVRKLWRRDDYVEITGGRDFHVPGFRMLTCNARDQVACAAAAHGWTHFERPTPEYFAQAVKQAGAGLVVDVGANTGFYTLLALSVSGSVTVAAYEPFAKVRAILAANLRANRRGRGARVYAYAVSDRSGRRKLYVPDGAHGLVETSASLGSAFKPGSAAACEVQAVTLDEQHRGLPRVAVIKVDAEGHDLQVLRGAAAILKRDRPVVFLEVLPGSDEAALTALMRETGYADRPLWPDGDLRVEADVRFHGDAWNHMWTPLEMAPVSLPDLQ